MQKILIVDDEKAVRYSFRKLLNTGIYDLFEAENYESAIEVFNQEKPDLVIVDIEMPGKSGLDLLKTLKENHPNLPVIMVTAYGTGDRVINAMKYGAFEYVEKPFEIPRLISLIEDALRSVQVVQLADGSRVDKNATEKKPKPDTGTEKIIGESPAIKDVYKLIGRVATSDASILITGESGTGKELVARAIHFYSDRASKPFIAINCAAIPETLLESELFGYDKGAFTGATKDKPGKFEEANGGTLFLDEIGDMGLALQSKLLRILQEGYLERLGSSKTIKIDVRIVTATNRNLETLISNKSFREDLYYRIRVITIALPPLRMRKDDIPLLVNHFILKYALEARVKTISIHPKTMESLMEHSWPGNIRELENTIKRALILSKGNIITPDLISKDYMSVTTVQSPEPSPIMDYLSNEIMSREGEIFNLVSQGVEKDLINWALNKTGMNQAQAARLLGISRVMLHERIEKYGLQKR